MNSVIISRTASVFDGKKLPEEAKLVGYTAIIDSLALALPIPETISIISKKNKKYSVANFDVYPFIVF